MVDNMPNDNKMLCDNFVNLNLSVLYFGGSNKVYTRRVKVYARCLNGVCLYFFFGTYFIKRKKIITMQLRENLCNIKLQNHQANGKRLKVY